MPIHLTGSTHGARAWLPLPSEGPSDMTGWTRLIRVPYLLLANVATPTDLVLAHQLGLLLMAKVTSASATDPSRPDTVAIPRRREVVCV